MSEPDNPRIEIIKRDVEELRHTVYGNGDKGLKITMVQFGEKILHFGEKLNNIEDLFIKDKEERMTRQKKADETKDRTTIFIKRSIIGALITIACGGISLSLWDIIKYLIIKKII